MVAKAPNFKSRVSRSTYGRIMRVLHGLRKTTPVEPPIAELAALVEMSPRHLARYAVLMRADGVWPWREPRVVSPVVGQPTAKAPAGPVVADEVRLPLVIESTLRDLLDVARRLGSAATVRERIMLLAWRSWFDGRSTRDFSLARRLGLDPAVTEGHADALAREGLWPAPRRERLDHDPTEEEIREQTAAIRQEPGFGRLRRGESRATTPHSVRLLRELAPPAIKRWGRDALSTPR